MDPHAHVSFRTLTRRERQRQREPLALTRQQMATHTDNWTTPSVSLHTHGSTGSLNNRGAWWDTTAMSVDSDYEVVFTEDRLGLTLRCQAAEEAVGSMVMPTTVKSTSDATQRVQEGDMLLSINDQSVVNMDFRDVRRLLRVSSRPIRLRFRPATSSTALLHSAGSEYGDGDSDGACSDIATASGSSSSSCGSSSAESDTGDVSDLAVFALPVAPIESDDDDDERDDDLESHEAVQSESFGDADSTRTTEASSVITDMNDFDYKLARHSSLFSAFLRKPFRRIDGIDPRRIETRFGAVPPCPRIELAAESPSKAAIRVYWTEYPTSVSSHIQFARDRTVKVWRNWSGRIRRSRDNDRELTTTIFGLEHGKSYVVRVRFAFNRTNFILSEWSGSSLPVQTIGLPGRNESLRIEYMRAPRR